jgi:hypothetical protein
MKASVAAALMLLLCACGGPNLSPTTPSGFNLQGEWELVVDRSERDLEGDDYIRMRTGDRRELARGGMGRDFPVIRAQGMIIEQNADSMGIRYSTGDYRDVSWGRRELGMWKVNAGWIDDRLYIISEAHDAKGTEIMMLSEDGNTLRIDVEIDAGDDYQLDRVFRRVDSAR